MNTFPDNNMVEAILKSRFLKGEIDGESWHSVAGNELDLSVPDGAALHAFNNASEVIQLKQDYYEIHYASGVGFVLVREADGTWRLNYPQD